MSLLSDTKARLQIAGDKRRIRALARREIQYHVLLHVRVRAESKI